MTEPPSQSLASAARDALRSAHQGAFAYAYPPGTVPRIGKALIVAATLVAGAGALLLLELGIPFGDRPMALVLLLAAIMLAAGGALLIVAPRAARALRVVVGNLFPPKPVDPAPWKTDFLGREQRAASELGGDWRQHVSAALGSLIWSAVIVGIFWWVLMTAFPSDRTVPYLIMALVALSGFWRPAKGALRAMRVFRYGQGEIEYESFPYFTGGPVSFRIRASRELASQSGKASLRCIHRYRATHSRRGGTREKVMFEQVREIHFNSMGEGAVRFDVPADAPSSQGPTRRFGWRWIVKVRVEQAGVDYDDSFPVPVYARGGEAGEPHRYRGRYSSKRIGD